MKIGSVDDQQTLFQRSGAGQQLGEPLLSGRNFHRPVEAWSTHVAFDQEHMPCLCLRVGKIYRKGRFPFLEHARRDGYNLAGAVQFRQHHLGGYHAYRFRVEITRLIQYRLTAISACPPGQDRQRRQQWSLQLPLDVFARLHCVLQAIEDHGAECSEKHSQCRGDHHRACLCRTNGRQGRHGRVYNARTGSLSISGGAGFLEAGQEGLVELAVGRSLLLEHAELDFLAVQALDGALGLRQRLLNSLFRGPSRLVFLDDARDQILNLPSCAVPRSAQVAGGRDKLRMLGSIALRSLGQLFFRFGLDLLGLLYRRALDDGRH